MGHNISDYISNRAALVVALVEKGLHRSEEELLNNWEEYTSFCPPWSEHLMKAAYVLAEPVKKQLRCYGFICMWMGSVRVGMLVLQKTDSSATTRGKVRGVLVDGLRYGFCGRRRIFDHASPVLCADEDVHKPSADGLGTYQLRGCFNGRIPSLLSGVRKGTFWWMGSVRFLWTETYI